MTAAARHLRTMVCWGLWLMLGVLPTVGRAQAGVPSRQWLDTALARVVVTHPTVIAYLVVSPGAVDTLPDMAVVADDWSFAMATLREQLQRQGIRHALVTEPRLRISSRGAATVTIALGDSGAGYVFVRPGHPPCLRRGGADIDSVLVEAGRFFRGGTRARGRSAVHCDGVTPAPRPIP